MAALTSVIFIESTISLIASFIVWSDFGQPMELIVDCSPEPEITWIKIWAAQCPLRKNAIQKSQSHGSSSSLSREFKGRLGFVCWSTILHPDVIILKVLTIKKLIEKLLLITACNIFIQKNYNWLSVEMNCCPDKNWMISLLSWALESPLIIHTVKLKSKVTWILSVHFLVGNWKSCFISPPNLLQPSAISQISSNVKKIDFK